jgi:hypothetical protein
MAQEETKNATTMDYAKVEIEPDEPTDERGEEVHPSDDAVEEGVVEEAAREAKQIHMKVDADAPWKDRMWEGTLLLYFCCIGSALEQVYLIILSLL